MPKKIVILTTGQPSTNPRMVKEYTALKNAGYQVKVYYSFWEEWALEADNKLFATNEIDKKDFYLAGGSPFQNRMTYLLSRINQKLNSFIYKKTGKRSTATVSRVTPYLINAAIKDKADLYIAHNAGAWPAAIAGAKKNKAYCGVDLEDYQRGDFKEWEKLQKELCIRIEDKFIPQFNFATAGSPLIGKAYQKLYPSLTIIPVNNVFSKKFVQPENVDTGTSLKLFWFSQTVGPFRGIETVVKAMNLLPTEMDVSLYLLGKLSTGFDNKLREMSKKENVFFLPPVSPNDVFEIAAQYDIGLSIEIPYCDNKDFCLANKAFTYMLAGNCIIFSNTKAQIQFLKEYPESGFLYESENEVQLAALLNELYCDRAKLNKAKHDALKLATDELNWETESVKLLNLVQEVLA